MATYVHFSADERMWICLWRGEGLSQAEIARRLGGIGQPSAGSCVAMRSLPATCPTWRSDGTKPGVRAAADGSA